MALDTYRRGFIKRHLGDCGGQVRLVENLDVHAHWEWDLECTKCEGLLKEEDVLHTEIQKRRD